MADDPIVSSIGIGRSVGSAKLREAFWLHLVPLQDQHRADLLLPALDRGLGSSNCLGSGARRRAVDPGRMPARGRRQKTLVGNDWVD